ncbi:MAG: NAD(+)/NADH kinase [candidate division Zixibacteria bacterium]|nr:NAD(+)/NADH kinase [candidate division Zixibacteria bacterium]
MRFGLYANFHRPDASETVNFVIDWCCKNDHKVFFCDKIVDRITSDIESIPCDELVNNCDIVISLGGDGTILATARTLDKSEIPILGINLGSLGFLTQITPDDLESALKRVVSGSYQIEKRMVMQSQVIDGDKMTLPYALNDVVIDKGSVSRVINLSLYADGEYISSYTADGMVIATPTGSTAYSLATGGPILKPTMDALIVSPISPFSLTSRPLVFPAETNLEVRIRSEHGSALLTIDGQVATKFSPQGTIQVSKAAHSVRFIRFPENSFFDILRQKLHWGKLPVVDYKKSDILKKPSNRK